MRELNVEVERETELAAFESDEVLVNVDLKHPNGTTEKVRSTWLIGCDGANSAVRHELAVDFVGQTTSTVWSLADVRLSGAPWYDEAAAYLHPDGVVMVYPIRPPEFRIIADLKRHEPTVPTLEDIQTAISQRCHPGITVKGVKWLTSFRITELQVQEYRHRRVFLAGDAAHVHSPIGNQGMNLGIQDAVNLGWKLALVSNSQAETHPLLASYSQERQPVGAHTVQTTAMLSKAVSLRNRVTTKLRDVFLSLVANLDIVQKGLRQNAAELAVKYQHSLLSVDQHPNHPVWRLGGGVAAGERAPDGEVDGQRLWTSRSSQGFTLFLFEGLDCPQSEVEAIVKWSQIMPAELLSTVTIPKHAADLHRRYGAVESAAFVIRPDGYVGFRSQPALLTSIQDYFRHLGIRRVDLDHCQIG